MRTDEPWEGPGSSSVWSWRPIRRRHPDCPMLHSTSRCTDSTNAHTPCCCCCYEAMQAAAAAAGGEEGSPGAVSLWSAAEVPGHLPDLEDFPELVPNPARSQVSEELPVAAGRCL